jgi:4-amino-4-deoxy-L-arabinose transferase-like glycosyltransferase
MRPFSTLGDAWRSDRASVATPAALFLFALFVYTRSVGWGLPAGDETWAADAIKPSAPLAVAWQSFVAGGPNSGWFWFKYPPLHAFVLCAVYAPYLGWLWLVGGISGLQSEFPYGMTDPVSSLSALALLGRLVSAAMGAGCAVLVYHCVQRSFDRRSAALSALSVTLAYPMVFYSQTTNVEVPYLMWMLASLLGAVRLVEGDDRRRWWLLLGAGAALSVSTKELAAGAFAGLPPVLVGTFLYARRPLRSWIVGGLLAAVAFAAALLLANNAIWNPLGFWQRLGFLTQTLPREIALQYAPYYFPIELGGSRGAEVEFAQLSKAASRLLASLSWPTLLLSLAGWLLALRRRPAWALLLLAAGAAYYAVSVRAMLSLSLRYLLPITVLCAASAGLALGRLSADGPARTPRLLLAAAAVAWMFAYGWDVNRMMTGDGRYRAEAWLAASAPAGAAVEIYQRRTYLPRFPGHLQVHEIDYEQRDAEGFAARRPDLVVLSSSGLSGVTVRYKQDWQDDDEASDGYSPAQRSAGGQVMNFSRDANTDFLRRLEAGELGMEEAARFAVSPWIPRPTIQSLNPEITIYRRRSEATNRPSSPSPEAPAPN